MKGLNVHKSASSLSSLPLVYLFISVPIPHSLTYHSFITSLAICKAHLPIFFFWKALTIFVVYISPHVLKLGGQVSQNIVVEIFIGVALNLQVNLGETDVFIKLSLPKHKHNLFLHLFSFSLMDSNRIL